MTYTLTLNDTQARVMQSALDLFFRIHMGQFDEVAVIVFDQQRITSDVYAGVGPTWMSRRAGTEEFLQRAKTEAFPELGRYAFHSIASPHLCEPAKIACDLHGVIRHRLAWDWAGNPPERTPDMIQVCYDEPQQCGCETLAKIEATEN